MAEKRRRLIALREEKGLSQYSMAERLGMPRSTYAQIEVGRLPLRIETAAKVATILGCTIDALFHGEDGSETNPGLDDHAAAKLW